MNFKPLHDRIAVLPVPSEEKTTGGIIIPDTAKEKPMQGKVVAIGNGLRDKDGKLVVLYAGNKEAQHSYIEIAKDKGYEVLLLDSPIISHLIQKLESDNKDVTFVRVDSDHIDNLINQIFTGSG